MQEEVVIEKLVHGGQGMATLQDGRKVFVWGALPDERAVIKLTKRKKGYAEAVVNHLIKSSVDRVEPKDEAFLSTSPWQMMTYEAENRYKQQILIETFEREKVVIPPDVPFISDNNSWNYRNKMEYSFWADEQGLSLALFERGSRRKVTVKGSSIAMPLIDEVAQRILKILNMHKVRGSQLKTMVIRASQAGDAVVGLFVKDETFPKLDEFSKICKGLAVYYSDPRSPASVITKELYSYDNLTLNDPILGFDTVYDVNSFFQVNIPIFETALKRIKDNLGDKQDRVELYAGVGTMVRPLSATKMVEIDEQNIKMAHKNVGHVAEVIHASAEGALEHIPAQGTVIVDPPRTGLHPKVVGRILGVKPKRIIYLSCNPITQARDLFQLQDAYTIETLEGYNFFPRTPHIESLAILIAK